MPAELPKLGIGTFKNTDSDECAESVRVALEAGYRHVDTAQGYGNEEAVGRGIAEADVGRDDIVVATKVDTGNLAYHDVHESTRESLDRLDVDVIDLLYIHWPTNTYEPEETLRAFDELVDDGLIRHVGVSNFEPRHLEEARDILDAPIFANQVEMHPLLPQKQLVADAREHDYWVVAYSPLGQTKILDDPIILEVAESESLSPAQVCLAWLCSQDAVAAIPKATGKEHIRENFAAREVTLSPASLERLNGIERQRRLIDFDDAPWNR